MICCKAELVVWGLALIGPWLLAGCGGTPTEAGTVVTTSGGSGDRFPFPDGIGVSPPLAIEQGFAINGSDNIYASYTMHLTAYDRNWRVRWDNTKPFDGLPSSVSHLGDVDFANGYIYGPVEAWGGCSSYLPAVIAVYSADTGKLVTWGDISADGHEASSVAVVPATGQLVVSSFCSNQNGFTTLWAYDLKTLLTNPPGSKISYSGTITLSSPIANIQGVSWNESAGQFAISADNNGPAGSIWLASAAGAVTGPVYIVPSSIGVELEGVDYNSGNLYYLESGYIFGIGPVPDMPVFSLASGTYCGAQSLIVSDSTSGAAIHYTIDGTTPTANSALYDRPIAVTISETVKAIAIGSGLASSAQTSAAYTIATSGCTAGSAQHRAF